MKTVHIGNRANQKYRIEWSNGEIEIVKVPSFIGPSQVKKNLPYSEVEMFIARGYHAWFHDLGSVARGPQWVKVTDDGKLSPAFRSAS